MRPTLSSTSLCHLELRVKNLEICTKFYKDLLGMSLARPLTAEATHLTNGKDDLALVKIEHLNNINSPLGHLGFYLDNPLEVDKWHIFLKDNNVEVSELKQIEAHKMRTFFCTDPEGNKIQFLHKANIIID